MSQLTDPPNGRPHLMDPAASGWEQIESSTITLEPVPLDAQPTEYIRVAFEERSYGSVHEADLAYTVEDGRLFVRLDWTTPSDGAEFPDAAAVILARDDEATPLTHGSTDHPVDMWYWRSVFDDGELLESSGPGVVRRTGSVDASATRDGDRWTLVLAGPTPETGRLGVALWDGSNEERAGIGSVTPEWFRFDEGSSA